MKGFGKRLIYYLFGFGLGCIVVWVTLIKDRNRPAWMPEGRVLESLVEKDISISGKIKCQLECNNISLDFMDSIFWKNAAIDFSKSATKRKPCPEYYIKSKTKNGKIFIVFVENCDDDASLRKLELVNQKKCDCE